MPRVRTPAVFTAGRHAEAELCALVQEDVQILLSKSADTCYCHRVTKKLSPDRAKKAPASAAERQRKYRVKQQLVSIDISRRTAATLEKMRSETRVTNDVLIARALELAGSSWSKADAHGSHTSSTNQQPATSEERHTLTKLGRSPAAAEQEVEVSEAAKLKPGKRKSAAKTRLLDRQAELFDTPGKK